MKRLSYYTLIALGFTFLATSCVSSKKYEELQMQSRALKTSNIKLNDRVSELEAQQAQLEKMQADLETEKAALDKEKSDLEKRLSDLTAIQQKNLSSHQLETGELLKQIQLDKESLLQKEDELRDRTEKFNRLQADFNAHNERLMELERMLAAKDSSTNALRRKVADALLGFEGKGLTVTKKNGKVYVSLDEKLLFNSGSYAIESRGAEALHELGKVLEKNPDINVMVEGHTDDVPYRGTSDLKDNWDLSVKRATTVVRTLLQGTTVNPERIAAAGRSEYVPLDPSRSADGRQKNRRTEIILTPKLDELLEVLGSN